MNTRPIFSRLRKLPVSLIHTPDGEDRPADNDLIESIRVFGVISPIIVRRDGMAYRVISGARRLAAAKSCGKMLIPAFIVNCDEQYEALLCLTENYGRRDMDFYRSAQLCDMLSKRFGWSAGDISSLCGCQPGRVSELLRVLDLDPGLLGALSACGLTEKHALALLRLGDENVRQAALCEMAYRRIPANGAARYVDALISHGEAPASPPEDIYIMKDVQTFLNTVEQGVSLMKCSGIDARWDVSDSPYAMDITVTIPVKVSEQCAGR